MPHIKNSPAEPDGSATGLPAYLRPIEGCPCGECTPLDFAIKAYERAQKSGVDPECMYVSHTRREGWEELASLGRAARCANGWEGTFELLDSLSVCKDHGYIDVDASLAAAWLSRQSIRYDDPGSSGLCEEVV